MPWRRSRSQKRRRIGGWAGRLQTSKAQCKRASSAGPLPGSPSSSSCNDHDATAGLRYPEIGAAGVRASSA
eukprot:2202602-Rhodomonas_salina.2